MKKVFSIFDRRTAWMIGFAFAICHLPYSRMAAQTVDPKAYYTDSDGNQKEETAVSEQAPLNVEFRANPSDMDGMAPFYEWVCRKTELNEKNGTPREVFSRSDEENTTYTFTESGSYSVVLKTRLTATDVELDSVVISVTIPESQLEFPNAFSPNGDGINDVFRAKKDKVKSIVEFKAMILNRWGQKLYEWTDPKGGWDGTFNGHDVKPGVYFVLVKAKGADGVEYNIKRDVNLLRGYIEGSNSTTGSGQ